MLLKFASDAVAASEASEGSPNRKFVHMWENSSDGSDFADVKTQYLRMLQSIPDTNASEWRIRVGIKDEKAVDESANQPVQTDAKEFKPEEE